MKLKGTAGNARSAMEIERGAQERRWDNGRERMEKRVKNTPMNGGEKGEMRREELSYYVEEIER
jgi:hypothetical protein